jgi:hypothetical protein
MWGWQGPRDWQVPFSIAFRVFWRGVTVSWWAEEGKGAVTYRELFPQQLVRCIWFNDGNTLWIQFVFLSIIFRSTKGCGKGKKKVKIIVALCIVCGWFLDTFPESSVVDTWNDLCHYEDEVPVPGRAWGGSGQLLGIQISDYMQIASHAMLWWKRNKRGSMWETEWPECSSSRPSSGWGLRVSLEFSPFQPLADGGGSRASAFQVSDYPKVSPGGCMGEFQQECGGGELGSALSTGWATGSLQ